MNVDTVVATPTLEHPRAWHDLPVTPRPGPEKPASLNQERLWLRWFELADDPAFTISTTIRLPRRVDAAAFGDACDLMGDRQPTLRTTFARGPDGIVAQHLTGHRRCPVVFEEAPPTVTDEELARRAGDVARQPFELVGGEPGRFAVFQLGDEGAVLQVAMHHAFTDWVSMQTLLRDLVGGYDALLAGMPAAGAQPTVDYGDFASWERDLLRRGGWQDDVAHWRPRFSNLPLPLWETGSDRNGPLDLSAGRLTFDVDAHVAADFGLFARRGRVTMFMAVLAAYRLLLHWATGREDVVIGVPASARVRPEVEELVGYFLNLVPLHGTVDPDATVAELFATIRAATAEDMLHATVSTGALYQAFAPDVCPWRALPFQARLIFLSAHEGVNTPSASLSVEVQTGGTPYDLTLALWAVGGAMFGRFDYRRAVLDDEEVARLEAGLRCLLRVLPDAADRTVAEVVKAVDEDVRRQLRTRGKEQ